MADAARFRLTGAQSRASRAYDLWDDVLSICRTRASALSRAVSGEPAAVPGQPAALLEQHHRSYASSARDHFMELARWIPAFPAALLCHVNSGLDLRTQLRQSRGPDHEAHEAPRAPRAPLSVSGQRRRRLYGWLSILGSLAGSLL
ncbi:unnamed protein product [Symbiodinium sp. CCMP2592]|nr:unnamed protein product [Symbiodinium sp. CCMP2592]